ncbi:hypothetical protein IV203_013300 [Nitzschia inconspicua]|uniref:Uncharacterized protein n=1 Tax=Nitzschia inconspicua TaxID=303405 RepID=A0A9K3M6P3_9STRA|nr:hypothetical protein IV203_013300 [Nitzschia inconspicua]
MLFLGSARLRQARADLLWSSRTLQQTTITASSSCIQDFQELYDLESAILDTSVNRTYVICPNKLYEVGYLDSFFHNLRQNQAGGPPLPLRSNMTIRCGDDGSIANLCFITGGHLQVDGTAMRGIDDTAIENVLLEGFVFINANKYSFWATKRGSVTFRDCEWRDFTNTHDALIMLDYYDVDNPDEELVVTFENCRFHENRYFGYGSRTALIVGNSEQNRLVVQGTIFKNNNMTWNNTSPESTTHLIESLGPTILEENCFLSNSVVGSTVVVYGNEFRSTRIYSAGSAGQECAFASVYESYDQFKSRSPLCVAATKEICDLDVGLEVPMDDNATIVRRYVPFAIGAMDYDLAKDSDLVFEGGCTKGPKLNKEDGMDAQNNVDDVCKEYGGCFISHTTPGEQVLYRFGHYDTNEDADGLVYVDIIVRMASAQPKLVQLDLLYEAENDTADSWIFETGGGGFSTYEEYTWEKLPLRGYEPVHSLVVTFLDGMVNFCMIRASYSVIEVDLGSERTSSPTNTSQTGNLQIVASEPSLSMSDTIPPRTQDLLSSGA